MKKGLPCRPHKEISDRVEDAALAEAREEGRVTEGNDEGIVAIPGNISVIHFNRISVATLAGSFALAFACIVAGAIFVFLGVCRWWRH